MTRCDTVNMFVFVNLFVFVVTGFVVTGFVFVITGFVFAVFVLVFVSVFVTGGRRTGEVIVGT